MPANTTDQGISRPVDADSADNPVAFVNELAGLEPRLVRTYTNEADRTAKMTSLAENNVSGLAAEDRVEVYNGTNHISLYCRSLFTLARLSADFNLTLSSTALQSVTGLVSPVPATGTFGFEGFIFYSSSTTADIKFAFLLPAGGGIGWSGLGVVTGGTSSGDCNFATAGSSDGPLSYGGNGVGQVLAVHIKGAYVAGGTAGNLQFRAAQNTSDATQSVVHSNSRLEVFRIV